MQEFMFVVSVRMLKRYGLMNFFLNAKSVLPKIENNIGFLQKKEITIIAKNINKEFKEKRTLFERTAEFISSFCGNMWFVYLHVVIFGVWLWFNIQHYETFDPPPFGLLTLIVSLEAIFLSSFILISQNRQNRIAELRAEMDYQVNLKAEKEIAEIVALLKSNK